MMEGELERNHRMELQYDGTGLHGWAKQEGLLTVEGNLQAALQTVLGHTPRLVVAGRTDAGVHARRQVVSLSLPEHIQLEKLRGSLNALTPPGIVITRIAHAPEEFDARRNAASRSYRYYLWMGAVVPPFWHRYCSYAPRRLDLEALAAAAAAVEGRHNFTAFTPAESEHIHFERQVLRCRWRRTGGSLLGGIGGGGATGGRPFCLEIEAVSFLRHMVRTLVGTMVEVGEGTRDLESFRALLSGAPRPSGGPTTPAQGLFLWDIKYPPAGASGECDQCERTG